MLLQRPSYTGSERFKLNELEYKPEQEESLQRLVRTGGDHLYMSPSYEWIAEATDLVEAVPLFIYERIVMIDGKPTTVFEVDQEGLEQTVRQIAEHWAENIDLTIQSEHISLARSILVKLDPKLALFAQQVRESKPVNRDISDLIALESLGNKENTSFRIAKLAESLGSLYNQLAVEIEAQVEKCWARQSFITRIEAFEKILLERDLIRVELVEKALLEPTSSETKRLLL